MFANKCVILLLIYLLWMQDKFLLQTDVETHPLEILILIF